MAQYKVLKTFRDKNTKETYKKGQRIEGEFLERMDTKGEDKEDQEEE